MSACACPLCVSAGRWALVLDLQDPAAASELPADLADLVELPAGRRADAAGVFDATHEIGDRLGRLPLRGRFVIECGVCRRPLAAAQIRGEEGETSLLLAPRGDVTKDALAGTGRYAAALQCRCGRDYRIRHERLARYLADRGAAASSRRPERVALGIDL